MAMRNVRAGGDRGDRISAVFASRRRLRYRHLSPTGVLRCTDTLVSCTLLVACLLARSRFGSCLGPLAKRLLFNGLTIG